MKLAALFSGGKDSTYATYLASKEHDIGFLVTLKSENRESYMFHTAAIDLTKTQADLMGIPIVLRKTKGVKEEELQDLKSVLEDLKRIEKINGIVTGAIASEYQATRIEAICKELGLKCISPLWHRDPAELLLEMISNGFEIVITAVGAEGLDKTWLGRKIDERCAYEIIGLSEKYGIHITGEGGEYETLVVNCPLFSKKIDIIESEKIWDEKTRSGELLIKKFETADKLQG